MVIARSQLNLGLAGHGLLPNAGDDRHTSVSPPATPMSSAAKQLLREALDQVPDDATVEDVMERLYFLAKVARGLDAAERGDVVPHDEIEREFLAGE